MDFGELPKSGVVLPQRGEEEILSAARLGWNQDQYRTLLHTTMAFILLLTLVKASCALCLLTECKFKCLSL